MDEIATPWRDCLALAWEAYHAGAVPVGAVVVDGSGEIVARGRNRIFEAGSRLAHAEVEALQQLGVERRYEDHAVYSLLEPCLLCVGAALMSTIGTIKYATADAYGGACNRDISVPDFLRRNMTIEGPADGSVGAIGAALQTAFWLGRSTRIQADVLRAFGDDACAAGARLRETEVSEDFEEALPLILGSLAG